MPRVALVTGANRGLGLETARQLLARGLRVVMAGRDQAAVERARSGLGDRSSSSMSVRLDVTDAASIAAAAHAIGERWGGVDVLVNNAAVLLDEDSDVLAIPAEHFRDTLDTNLLGVIEVCRVFVPGMAERGYGRVVNVSSGAGQLSTIRRTRRRTQYRRRRSTLHVQSGCHVPRPRRSRQRGRPGLGAHRHGWPFGAAVGRGWSGYHRLLRHACSRWSDRWLFQRSALDPVVKDVRLHRGGISMAEETQMEQIRKRTVVFRVPEMDAVGVRRDVEVRLRAPGSSRFTLACITRLIRRAARAAGARFRDGLSRPRHAGNDGLLERRRWDSTRRGRGLPLRTAWSASPTPPRSRRPTRSRCCATCATTRARSASMPRGSGSGRARATSPTRSAF